MSTHAQRQAARGRLHASSAKTSASMPMFSKRYDSNEDLLEAVEEESNVAVEMTIKHVVKLRYLKSKDYDVEDILEKMRELGSAEITHVSKTTWDDPE